MSSRGWENIRRARAKPAIGFVNAQVADREIGETAFPLLVLERGTLVAADARAPDQAHDVFPARRLIWLVNKVEFVGVDLVRGVVEGAQAP